MLLAFPSHKGIKKLICKFLGIHHPYHNNNNNDKNLFHTNYKRILFIIFSTASKLLCQFCLEVLHLSKQHPTPAIKQQQATSTDLRAGEFLDDALDLKDPMMLLISSQSVGWMDRGYGLIIFKHVQGTRMGCNSLVTLHCIPATSNGKFQQWQWQQQQQLAYVMHEGGGAAELSSYYADSCYPKKKKKKKIQEGRRLQSEYIERKEERRGI